jgi:hypothetical protein
MTYNETPGSQRRKKRRFIQSKDLGSERLGVSIGESLDILSRAQNRKLIAEVSELPDL